jgi:hypothetical protein
MANRSFACTCCGELKRSPAPNFEQGIESDSWPKHCNEPMFLLGYRASQAATQIDKNKRVIWLKLGGKVIQHSGKKKWRPILKQEHLKDAYPLT